MSAQFSVGDIVRVERLPENTDLPDRWDAIVVDVYPDDGGRIEVAWLSRFSTTVPPRLSPMREAWDDRTSLIDVDADATVTLLKKASYTEVQS